jgi:hypothetical protein
MYKNKKINGFLKSPFLFNRVYINDHLWIPVDSEPFKVKEIDYGNKDDKDYKVDTIDPNIRSSVPYKAIVVFSILTPKRDLVYHQQRFGEWSPFSDFLFLEYCVAMRRTLIALSIADKAFELDPPDYEIIDKQKDDLMLYHAYIIYLFQNDKKTDLQPSREIRLMYHLLKYSIQRALYRSLKNITNTKDYKNQDVINKLTSIDIYTARPPYLVHDCKEDTYSIDKRILSFDYGYEI